MGLGAEANEAFSTAVRIYHKDGNTWAAWGDYCADVFAQSRNIAFAQRAITCYLYSAAYAGTERDEIQHRVARMFWLLTYDEEGDDLAEAGSGSSSSGGVLARIVSENLAVVPAWVWIQWIPHLVTMLGRATAPVAAQILLRVALDYPQAVYGTLRAVRAVGAETGSGLEDLLADMIEAHKEATGKASGAGAGTGKASGAAKGGAKKGKKGGKKGKAKAASTTATDGDAPSPARGGFVDVVPPTPKEETRATLAEAAHVFGGATAAAAGPGEEEFVNTLVNTGLADRMVAELSEGIVADPAPDAAADGGEAEAAKSPVEAAAATAGMLARGCVCVCVCV